MKEYLYKKEYACLYLSKFCYSLANSLIEIFGVVMLYRSGIPIHKILLIYGLRFGIMGLATPLYIKVSSKFGIATCALVASVLRIISIYMIIFEKYNNMIAFILFFSLPGALSNPIENAVSAKYIETKHRGRFNSIRSISQILGETIASVIVTYGVISSNKILLFIIVILFFLLYYIFTLLLNYKPEIGNKGAFKETIKYILTEKDDLKIIYSLRSFQIIERLFIPLYLYLILKDFVLFATVVTISLLIQVITIIITGRYTDKNILKTNSLISKLRAIISVMFLVLRSKVAISTNKMIYDNMQKVYDTTLMSSTENIMKKSNKDSSLLSSISQMSLCFAELVVLIAFSIFAYYFKEEVFILIFLLTTISTILINRLTNKNLI